MIVRVDRLDVECEEFSFLTSDNKGYGGVGTEDIPEDIANVAHTPPAMVLFSFFCSYPYASPSC